MVYEIQLNTQFIHLIYHDHDVGLDTDTDMGFKPFVLFLCIVLVLLLLKNFHHNNDTNLVVFPSHLRS